MRDEKSLEEERLKINKRLESLYSQFKTRNMLLDESALRSVSKTEKNLQAVAQV